MLDNEPKPQFTSSSLNSRCWDCETHEVQLSSHLLWWCYQCLISDLTDHWSQDNVVMQSCWTKCRSSTGECMMSVSVSMGHTAPHSAVLWPHWSMMWVWDVTWCARVGEWYCMWALRPRVTTGHCSSRPGINITLPETIRGRGFVWISITI